jgi:hypothetical protein
MPASSLWVLYAPQGATGLDDDDDDDDDDDSNTNSFDDTVRILNK